MTEKTMNLQQAREVATDVLLKYGRDYKNLVIDSCGESVTGCVNVVLVKDGKRVAPASSAKIKGMVSDEGYTLEPGCFVGTILITAGLATAEDFAEKVYGARVTEAVAALEITLTDDARNWLSYAQSKQDSDGTWGEAFAQADRLVLNYLTAEDRITL